MAKVNVVVCDVCEDVGKPTQRYRVSKANRHRVLDLCPTHAESLEKLLAGAKPHRRRFEEAVTTVEEIEEKKAKK